MPGPGQHDASGVHGVPWTSQSQRNPLQVGQVMCSALSTVLYLSHGLSVYIDDHDNIQSWASFDGEAASL
jgi:hypothetical protein